MAITEKKTNTPIIVYKICRLVSCWRPVSMEVSVVERIMAMPKMISSVTAPINQKSKCRQILPRSMGVQVAGNKWKVEGEEWRVEGELATCFFLLPTSFAFFRRWVL